MEINVKKWTANNLIRYYLTDNSGNDLGYAQESSAIRDDSSSYDQHRIAKGDINNIKESHTVQNDTVYNAITLTNVTGHKRLDFNKLSTAAGGKFFNPWAKKGEKKSGYRGPAPINA